MFLVIGWVGFFLLLFGGFIDGEAENSKISAILMSVGLFLGLISILFLSKGF